MKPLIQPTGLTEKLRAHRWEVIALAFLLTCFSQKVNIMNQEEDGKKIGRLIAMCWVDENFRQKTMTDPVAMLKTEGVGLPVDITVNVFADSHKVFSLLLPKQLLS